MNIRLTILLLSACIFTSCGSSRLSTADYTYLLPHEQNYAGVLDAVYQSDVPGTSVSHAQAYFYDENGKTRTIGHHISLDGGGLTVHDSSLIYWSNSAGNWGATQTWVLADHAHTFTQTIQAPAKFQITLSSTTLSRSKHTSLDITYSPTGSDSVNLTITSKRSDKGISLSLPSNMTFAFSPESLVALELNREYDVTLTALNWKTFEIGGGKFLIRSASIATTHLSVVP